MKTPKIQEHMGKNIYSKVRKTKNFCVGYRTKLWRSFVSRLAFVSATTNVYPILTKYFSTNSEIMLVTFLPS